MKMGWRTAKLGKFGQSFVIVEQGIDEEDLSSTQAILYRFLFRCRYPAELRPWLLPRLHLHHRHATCNFADPPPRFYCRHMRLLTLLTILLFPLQFPMQFTFLSSSFFKLDFPNHMKLNPKVFQSLIPALRA